MEALDEKLRQGGDPAVREASRFLLGTDSVHRSLHAVAKCLDELSVPYAVAGGMALVSHGYMRTTEDVDVLVTPEGYADSLDSYVRDKFLELWSGVQRDIGEQT